MGLAPSTAVSPVPQQNDCQIAEQWWLPCRVAQAEGGKQVPNRSRPTRNKTKKVIGGATDEEIAEHAARPRMPRPAAVRQLQRHRSKGKNGKMRVGSKHINEAAEALLGMGSGFVDDDALVCFQQLSLFGSITVSPCYDMTIAGHPVISGHP